MGLRRYRYLWFCLKRDLALYWELRRLRRLAEKTGAVSL